jgi:hypothetical protein
MILSATLLGGCAAWSSRHYSAVDHIEFLSQALQADARARDTLWRNLVNKDGSDDSELRAALLQSVAGHSGTNVAEARTRLDALAAKNPASLDVASVARLRLSQLNEGVQCRDEVAELKQRLARVVDIERRLNQGK